MKCHDCGKEITGIEIPAQRSSTHRDYEVAVCFECAKKAGDDLFVATDYPPDRCPNCGASIQENAYFDSPNIEDGAVFQDVCCSVCDREWTEVYHFAGYHIVLRGKVLSSCPRKKK